MRVHIYPPTHAAPPKIHIKFISQQVEGMNFPHSSLDAGRRVLTSGLLLISSFFFPLPSFSMPPPFEKMLHFLYICKMSQIQEGTLYIKHVCLKIILVFATLT